LLDEFSCVKFPSVGQRVHFQQAPWKVPSLGTEGSPPASTMESAISTTDGAHLPVRNVDQPDSNRSLFSAPKVVFSIKNHLQFWLPWMRNHHQKTNDCLYSTSLCLTRMLVFYSQLATDAEFWLHRWTTKGTISGHMNCMTLGGAVA
jgi:hypothetical protein